MTVQASSLVGRPRRYDCVWWFGRGDVEVGVGRGEDACGGSLTIAGTRTISSCSNVVASTTCNSDVCYRPAVHVNQAFLSEKYQERRTSVKVMISFPPIPVLNLTFLTPQPGALCPGIVQSHESSYNHPLALPVALFPLLDIPPGGARLRSVVNTFIGLLERTSHTATIPS